MIMPSEILNAFFTNQIRGVLIKGIFVHIRYRKVIIPHSEGRGRLTVSVQDFAACRVPADSILILQ